MKIFFHSSFVLVLICCSCSSPNTVVDESISTIQEVEGELAVSVSSSCYSRSEYCANGACLYSTPCSCINLTCPTDANMPDIAWNASNITTRAIQITKIVFSYLDASSEQTLATYECGLSSFSIEPQQETSWPTVSCTEPVAPQGYELAPAGVNYRTALLKLTIIYLDENGNEVGSSVEGNIEVETIN